MKRRKTHLRGLFVIENIFFSDSRGGFMEFWNQSNFQKQELNTNFSQDNISFSKRNVIRGLHFQNQPYSQIKYVNVLHGRVMDVVVDLRQKSNTFGKYFSIELSSKNHYGLWIPTGFAHGFLSLEENTVFAYKCYGDYSPKHEQTIKWNDPDINIKWGITDPILSEKDKNGISLKQYIKSKNINA